METRKLQLVGNRSYSISIPKDWIRRNKLKNHDLVFVEETDNNKIEVSIIRKHEDVKILEMNVDEIVNIKEFVVFCYEKNIDNLILKSRGFETKRIVEIRNVIKYLDGYEIIREDNKTIEIRFLFKDINVNIPHIRRRMIYLLRFMIEQIAAGDIDSIDDSEMTTDQLYHLARRIIFSCIKNYNLMKENDITHEQDLFFVKDILKRLEKMADKIVELKNKKVTGQDIKTLLTIITLIEELLNKDAGISDTKMKLHNLKFDSRSDAGHTIRRIQDLCMDIVESHISIYFNNKYFKG